MSAVEGDLSVRRKRLKTFLEQEEADLRAELRRKQEAQKLNYLDNLRDQVREIRKNKEMQRDYLNDQRKESSIGGFGLANNAPVSIEAKEQYGNELREQMRQKQESLAKMKKEDEHYHKMMADIDTQSVRKEKEDIQKRKITQLQYTNDLKNQLADISERKKEETKQDQVASNVYNYSYINIGTDSKSQNALMKKQQNRDEYKRGLDEQLEQKLKLKDNDNNEVNGTQSYPFGNDEIDSGSKKVSIRMDQEGYMNYVKNQIEESKREDMVLEQACSEYFHKADDRRDSERGALKDAQYKLQEEAIHSWDETAIVKRHDRDVKDEENQIENLQNQKMYSDYRQEEELKKKELHDRNKQYQLDLLAQIKEKKERKDYY